MNAPVLPRPVLLPCPHTPACPAPNTTGHDAAQVIADHHDQGWVLLCGGVIVFDDTGELVGTTAVEPHRPEPLHRHHKGK